MSTFYWSLAAYLVTLAVFCWMFGGAARLGGPEDPR